MPLTGYWLAAWARRASTTSGRRRRRAKAIDDLGSWDCWRDWRNAVIAYYTRVEGVMGCPIGSLTSEVAPLDPILRNDLAAYFRRWAGLLANGVRRLRDHRLVDDGIDPDAIATELLAAVQGGLVLSQVASSLGPLEQALDQALAHLRHHSVQ
jgi:hypothetical protein